VEWLKVLALSSNPSSAHTQKDYRWFKPLSNKLTSDIQIPMQKHEKKKTTRKKQGNISSSKI
jgi:hypothetical protein